MRCSGAWFQNPATGMRSRNEKLTCPHWTYSPHWTYRTHVTYGTYGTRLSPEELA